MTKFIISNVMGVVFTVGDDVEGLLIPYIQSLKPDISVKKVKALKSQIMEMMKDAAYTLSTKQAADGIQTVFYEALSSHQTVKNR